MDAVGLQTIQVLGIYPFCMKCRVGTLLPLSDYGTEGSSVMFKAWACSDQKCGFQLRIDKGVVAYERTT